METIIMQNIEAEEAILGGILLDPEAISRVAELLQPIPLKGLLTPDVLRSDHAPFWYQGIPAVLITDTANLRSPHYHQPSDTMANLDPNFFEGSATIIYNVVAELLNSQTPFNIPHSLN